MSYSYLFGPVQSRRLGISLGIDLVQSKICSLNCVYCECGKTTELTLERKAYAPADAITAELTEYLATEPVLDYITFGGSGEPTLNTELGRVLRFVKESYPHYPCALLTNGTLFYLPDVRKDCAAFDLVLPNLDAVSDAVFAKVNRPHRDLDNGRIIEGLAAFRREYKGTIWLEVFIVPGINDTPEELQLLREAAQKISPDRIQLNTLDRPGTCDWVKPATIVQLQTIAGRFAPLPVEIITRQAVLSADSPLWHDLPATQESIRSLIARRPSTLEEIAGLTGLTINQAQALLSALVSAKSIAAYTTGKRTFYRTF